MVDLELQDLLDVRDLLFLRERKDRCQQLEVVVRMLVCISVSSRVHTPESTTYLRPAQEAVLAELLPVRPLPVLLRREAVESPKPMALLLVDRDEFHTLFDREHEVGQPLAEPVASPRRRHEGVAVGVREGIERPLCYEGRVGLGWGFIMLRCY